MEFTAYLEERHKVMQQEAQALMMDQRKDEGRAMMAKANIYQVFKAVYETALKTEADKEAAHEKFIRQLSVISAPWEEHLNQARKHGDAMEELIEVYKMEAVEEIRDTFLRGEMA